MGVGVGFALSYAARKDDKPFQRRTWKRANPGLDHLHDLEKVIRSEANDARRDPSALQTFKALRLNQGVPSVIESVLIDASTWRGAMDLPEPESQSREYCLGLDLGQNAAMSAAAAWTMALSGCCRCRRRRLGSQGGTRRERGGRTWAQRMISATPRAAAGAGAPPDDSGAAPGHREFTPEAVALGPMQLAPAPPLTRDQAGRAQEK